MGAAGTSLSPEQELRDRYARGEITIEQFERDMARLLRRPEQADGQVLYTPVYSPPAPQPQARGRSGMAIASLVTGVLAILTFVMWGAFLLSPLAIVFGILGRKDTRKNHKGGEGMATAGLALGIIAAVLTVPWIYVVFYT